MAAIFGVVALAPGFDLDALARVMQERLAFRAPDGFKQWQQDGCILGHGALHVGKAPEQAVQPLRLRDGRICLVDGFVANHGEVRRSLGVDAEVVLDDAQLLALAVERWGDACTDHVHGEFVLALWNPESRVLELVRDHLGGRPICYVQTPHLFAFASSTLALLSLPGVERRLDPLAIVTLWYGDAAYLKQDYSSFEGMPALAPGHRLTWRAGEATTPSRYWRLQPEERLRLHDEREYVDAFREVFGGAVDRSMRGSTGTALMLSGGIDSAAILAARRGFRMGGKADDLLCVSAVLGAGDDTPWAQEENRNILAMIRQHARAVQFAVPVTDQPGSLVSSADLAEVAWSWIQPMDMGLLVPSLACGLAKRNDCRLVLNGVDGDNMTSAGLHYIDGLMRAGQVRHAWSESVLASRVNTYLNGTSPARLFGRATLAALEPALSRRGRDRMRSRRDAREAEQHPVMAPALARAVDLPERLRAASALRAGDPAQLKCDHLAYWLGCSLGASEAIVSRHGMDIRHPWCDLQVLKFFQRLPVEYKARRGWTKWVVREACEPALGKEIAWHSGKRHLGALLNQQVLADAAPYLRVMLEEQRASLQGYVRDRAVDEAIDALASPEGLTGKKCDTVLDVVTLAGWLRHVHYIFQQGNRHE